MEDALLFIQQNLEWAPYLMFGLLLLAGLNLPISEDIMLFTAGILASKNPDMRNALFIGTYLGCYLSDLICFSVCGRLLGPKIFKIKIVAKFIDKKMLDKVSSFYEKYGIITLIFGRFIPFGVRNALFISAGLGKMNWLKFALSDLFACTISSLFFFSLYYTFGESVIDIVKKGNIILFSLVALSVVGYLVKKKTLRT